jgi:hypothetical protein
MEFILAWFQKSPTTRIDPPHLLPVLMDRDAEAANIRVFEFFGGHHLHFKDRGVAEKAQQL